MVNHSDTFRSRVNNRDLNTKSEEEHIAHFKLRMKERFDIDLTTDQYYEILKQVRENTKFNLVYKLNGNSSINEAIVEGKLVWVVYGRPEKKRLDHESELKPRLKTVLFPHHIYLVPPQLANRYDHQRFTEKVNKTIEQIIRVSNQINLRKQNPYKVLSQLPEKLRSLAKKYRTDKEVKNHWITTITDYLTGK